MKTYKFNFCKYTVTVIIEKKTYAKAKEEPKDEIKMEEPYADPIHVWFSDYCDDYIGAHEGVLAKSTLDGYRNIMNNHLQGLMACDAVEVCETVIQDAFDREIEKGLSKKTLKGYKTFVLKVIDEYYDETFKPEIRIEKEKTE